MKKQLFNKVMAVLFAIAMVLSTVPTSALAYETDPAIYEVEQTLPENPETGKEYTYRAVYKKIADHPANNEYFDIYFRGTNSKQQLKMYDFTVNGQPAEFKEDINYGPGVGNPRPNSFSGYRVNIGPNNVGDEFVIEAKFYAYEANEYKFAVSTGTQTSDEVVLALRNNLEFPPVRSLNVDVKVANEVKTNELFDLEVTITNDGTTFYDDRISFEFDQELDKADFVIGDCFVNESEMFTHSSIKGGKTEIELYYGKNEGPDYSEFRLYPGDTKTFKLQLKINNEGTYNLGVIARGVALNSADINVVKDPSYNPTSSFEITNNVPNEIYYPANADQYEVTITNNGEVEFLREVMISFEDTNNDQSLELVNVQPTNEYPVEVNRGGDVYDENGNYVGYYFKNVTIPNGHTFTFTFNLLSDKEADYKIKVTAGTSELVNDVKVVKNPNQAVDRKVTIESNINNEFITLNASDTWLTTTVNNTGNVTYDETLKIRFNNVNAENELYLYDFGNQFAVEDARVYENGKLIGYDFDLSINPDRSENIRYELRSEKAGNYSFDVLVGDYKETHQIEAKDTGFKPSKKIYILPRFDYKEMTLGEENGLHIDFDYLGNVTAFEKVEIRFGKETIGSGFELKNLRSNGGGKKSVTREPEMLTEVYADGVLVGYDFYFGTNSYYMYPRQHDYAADVIVAKDGFYSVTISTLGVSETVYLGVKPNGETNPKVDEFVETIELLNGNTTVNENNFDKVKAIVETYESLTAEEQALIPAETLATYKLLKTNYDTYKQTLADAEATLIAFEEAVAKIGNVEDVTLESETLIQNANELQNKVTDLAAEVYQERYVAAMDKLTLLNARIKELYMERDAKAVETLINAIGKVTLDSKLAILEARDAYDSLEEEARVLVSAEALKTLEAAEKAYEDLVNNADANKVIELIEKIGNVSLDSKADIEAARAAYNALSKADQAKVSAETLKLLTDAEAKYADLYNQAIADATIADIKAIGNVTLDSKEAIEAARASYDLLTDTQKAKVPADILKLLTDAEAKYDDLVNNTDANKVIELIEKIGNVTLDSKADIEAARAAYNALSKADQAKVSAETLKLLTDAEAKYADLVDEAEANKVIAKINALGEITLDSKEAIEEARAAYNLLTASQKAKVSKEVLKTLEDAEKTYVEVKDNADAEAAIALINDIGDVTLDSKEKIAMARRAYNALNANAKAKVSKEVLAVLETAETTYVDLEDTKSAEDTTDVIENIGKLEDVTLDSKTAIEEARKAYEALNDNAKAKVAKEVVEALEQAEAKYTDLKDTDDAEKVSDLIKEIGKVTLDSEDAIKEARAAYNLLSRNAKAKIAKEIVEILEQAEETYDSLVKDNVPETSDTSNVLLWSSMSAMTLCLAAIAFVLKLKRR